MLFNKQVIIQVSDLNTYLSFLSDNGIQENIELETKYS